MPQGSYQPPQRNRRSERNTAVSFDAFSAQIQTASPKNSPSPQKRKKKKQGLFSPLQWTVLGMLTAALLICIISSLHAASSLNALLEDRQAKEKAWQQEIARHKMLYEDHIRYYAAVNNIDPAFVAAVIKRESDFDPYAISRVSARGLMQIMPDTGEWLAGKVDVHNFSVDNLYDAETNIKMGCWYLGYLSRKFSGDPVTVACAYHAGQGNVEDHWLKKYSSNGKTLTIDEIPLDDTKYYARKVLEAYAIYQQHHY